MEVQACVNGARGLDEHARLSAVPQEVAAEAAAAVAAGARSIHLHPKNAAGRDSLGAADVARFVAAARLRCPATPVGVTTGAWAAPDPRARRAAIASWSTLPDFASVNWHEDGADDVAAALLDRGVDVEAGIWHHEGLERWLRSTRRADCFRVLLELPDADDVDGLAVELLTGVTVAEPDVAVLLHGEGASAWPMLELALQRGLRTRIGLEDTLHLPDGRPAPDNAALVRAALALADR